MLQPSVSGRSISPVKLGQKVEWPITIWCLLVFRAKPMVKWFVTNGDRLDNRLENL